MSEASDRRKALRQKSVDAVKKTVAPPPPTQTLNGVPVDNRHASMNPHQGNRGGKGKR